jgi:hypothetical protein
VHRKDRTGRCQAARRDSARRVPVIPIAGLHPQPGLDPGRMGLFDRDLEGQRLAGVFHDPGLPPLAIGLVREEYSNAHWLSAPAGAVASLTSFGEGESHGGRSRRCSTLAALSGNGGFIRRSSAGVSRGMPRRRRRRRWQFTALDLSGAAEAHGGRRCRDVGRIRPLLRIRRLRKRSRDVVDSGNDVRLRRRHAMRQWRKIGSQPRGCCPRRGTDVMCSAELTDERRPHVPSALEQRIPGQGPRAGRAADSGRR